MPPKGRGGDHGARSPALPTPVTQDSLVREFCAITGADAALAERALRLARGDLNAAITRFFSISDTSEDVRGPTLQPSGKRLTQPILNASKRAREAPHPEATRTDGERDAGGDAFSDEAETRNVLDRFAAALPRRPAPDADGWVASVPQALEPEMETREAALAWAAAALEMTSTAPNGERRRFEDAAFPANASSIDGKGAGPKSGRANAEPPRVPECRCGVSASIKEVFKDGKNQGRSFYACGTRPFSRFAKEKASAGGKDPRGCSFFSWADDAPSSERARATQWRRFEPPRFRLSAETRASATVRFRPSDVRQGAVGDCWLLSALAVIAERADLVDRLALAAGGGDLAAAGDAVAARAHAAGAYFVRLFLDGKWRGLVVDPRLPVRGVDTQVLRGANAAGSRSEKGGADADAFRPAYSRASGNQLWVPLVEKAHAKAHGSYHAISGGWISEGLVDLSGCPTETLRLRASSVADDATWARLLSWASARFPMGCATSRGDAERGIVGGHAYSVMDVREVRGLAVGRQKTLGESLRAGRRERRGAAAEAETPPPRDPASDSDGALRLVRVRNPWGRKEWNGEWGTGSEVWTKKLGAELGHVRADDGTFWMSFRDFVTRFSRVDVCKAHEGWFVNSLEMASSGAAFELEISPGEPAASWAYVMAMQRSKRGRGRAGFWYDDWHVAIYSRDEARDAWAPVTAAAGARERDSQTEVTFEPGVRYLVRAYSFARETRAESRHRRNDRLESAPATLRVYSARRLRVRPANVAAARAPSLAPAIHAGTLDAPEANGDADATGRVDRSVARVCGGAVVVCRTRGGAHVFAVNTSSKAELRVRLSVRARGARADVYQHPAPRAPGAEPRRSRRGRYRYVPPGGEAPGAARDLAQNANVQRLWSEHAVPAGRARLLAVAVATGPSESRRHALDVRVAAVGTKCAACAASEARRSKAAEDGNGSRREASRRAAHASLGGDCGVSPPPSGATAAALAAALAEAAAEAAASEIPGGTDDDDGDDDRDDRDTLVVEPLGAAEEEEEDDVVFVKETGPDAAEAETRGTRWTRRSEDDSASGYGSVAGAPPAALLTLFAHVPASAFARRVASVNAETRDGCAEIA